jgi:hypothetical protein
MHPWEPRGKILSLVSHYQKKYLKISSGSEKRATEFYPWVPEDATHGDFVLAYN